MDLLTQIGLVFAIIVVISVFYLTFVIIDGMLKIKPIYIFFHVLEKILEQVFNLIFKIVILYPYVVIVLILMYLVAISFMNN